VVQDLKEEVLAYERLLLHVMGFNLYMDLPDYVGTMKQVKGAWHGMAFVVSKFDRCGSCEAWCAIAARFVSSHGSHPPMEIYTPIHTSNHTRVRSHRLSRRGGGAGRAAGGRVQEAHLIRARRLERHVRFWLF
jgi:hypothetical protein